MPYKKFRDAILFMDEDILDQRMVKAMIDKVPTAKDIEMVHEFAKPKSVIPEEHFGKVEKFFWELRDIPHLPNRISQWSFKMDFKEDIMTIERMMKCLVDVLDEVKTSVKWAYCIQVILSVGNAMQA